MAAPNLANVSTITGKTTYATPSNTTENVILANAAASGKVLKVESIIATNLDGSASYAATVGINSAANGAGTTYRLISTIPVPANGSAIIVDKSTGVYLEEDKSLVVQSSTANKFTFTVSYEELS